MSSFFSKSITLRKPLKLDDKLEQKSKSVPLRRENNDQDRVVFAAPSQNIAEAFTSPNAGERYT